MPPRNREKKEKVRAFRKEVKTHKWFLYVLAIVLSLFLVYEAFTYSLSLEMFAGILFVLILMAAVGDWIHKRNVKMLKIVLLIFGVCLVASAFYSVPVVRAYSFSNGAVTSANGEITILIPYVTPPSTNFATTQFIGSIPLLPANAATLSLTWAENTLVNLGLDVVNAVIYAANIIIGFIVAIMAGLISVPVYLFDAVTVTEFGPVVDLLSFIPSTWAWLVTGVVWAIAITELIIVVLALVRLMRVAISALGEVGGQGEEALKEDTGELA